MRPITFVLICWLVASAPASAWAVQSTSVVDFLCALAQEYRQTGQLEQAVHELRKALLLAPDHARALRQLRELESLIPGEVVQHDEPRHAKLPDSDAGEVQWLSMSGPNTQRLFLRVPASSAGPLRVRILDADTKGRYDKMVGIPDTFTSFRLYGDNPRALDVTIIGPEHPDGTLSDVELGPLPPVLGERQGEHRVFRLEVEGLRGDDVNLFAFETSPATR